jgi:hypothetical protein
LKLELENTKKNDIGKPEMSVDIMSEEAKAQNLAKKVATADDEDEAEFLKLSHEISTL